MYHIVTYNGQFGFIKPWTAVRDGETFSQQFLTPSIVEGMRQKLGVTAIARHKITYLSLSKQQEVTQAKSWKYKSREKEMVRSTAIIDRHVMVEPTLYLAFEEAHDAQIAATQHLCLCRNEDIVFPEPTIQQMTPEQFDLLDGFELRFEKNDAAFLVGYNRFENNAPMYGWLHVSNNPLKDDDTL